MLSDVTVVLPTRNETKTLIPVINSIKVNLMGLGIRHSIVIIDDSDDPEMETILRKVSHNNVMYFHRQPREQTGLGTAIMLGLEKAHSEFVCVMDADGQHPPESVANMIRFAMNNEYPIVIGTRYTESKGTAGLNGAFRKVASQALRLIPRVLFPRIFRVTDPLSGLFIVKKDRLEFGKMKPIGWKTSLEVLLFSQLEDGETIQEFPYTFASRLGGESKANFMAGMQYFRHLISLTWRYYAPHR